MSRVFFSYSVSLAMQWAQRLVVGANQCGGVITPGTLAEESPPGAGWPLRGLLVHSSYTFVQHLFTHYISRSSSLRLQVFPKYFLFFTCNSHVITDLTPFNKVPHWASRRLWGLGSCRSNNNSNIHKAWVTGQAWKCVCYLHFFPLISMVLWQPCEIGIAIIIPFWRWEHWGLGSRHILLSQLLAE